MEPVRTLEEISDGKIYDIEDMVKAGTRGCEGCSACCHDVGDLVVLTPFDVYEMKRGLNLSFDRLLEMHLTLCEKNKIMLPYLKMEGTQKRCSFLNPEGRCSIHGYRPNICRLFPLGRIYEADHFKYFLQVNSCPKPNLENVKVKEWIGIENYEANKTFILEWHNFIKALTFRLKFVYDTEERQKINDYLMDTFYKMPLEEEKDFYAVFKGILPDAKKHLGIL